MISNKTFNTDGIANRFIPEFPILSEAFVRPYLYIYDPNQIEPILQDGTTNQLNWRYPDNLWIRGDSQPGSGDVIPVDKWTLENNGVLFYEVPLAGCDMWLEVATTSEEFGDSLIWGTIAKAELILDYCKDEAIKASESADEAEASATKAELEAWEAEAERLTAESYASEAPYYFVKEYTSNGDGTFSIYNTTSYSTVHWGLISDKEKMTELAKIEKEFIQDEIITFPLYSELNSPNVSVWKKNSDTGLFDASWRVSADNYDLEDFSRTGDISFDSPSIGTRTVTLSTGTWYPSEVGMAIKHNGNPGRAILLDISGLVQITEPFVSSIITDSNWRLEGLEYINDGEDLTITSGFTDTVGSFLPESIYNTTSKDRTLSTYLNNGNIITFYVDNEFRYRIDTPAGVEVLGATTILPTDEIGYLNIDGELTVTDMGHVVLFFTVDYLDNRTYYLELQEDGTRVRLYDEGVHFRDYHVNRNDGSFSTLYHPASNDIQIIYKTRANIVIGSNLMPNTSNTVNPKRVDISNGNHFIYYSVAGTDDLRFKIFSQAGFLVKNETNIDMGTYGDNWAFNVGSNYIGIFRIVRTINNVSSIIFTLYDTSGNRIKAPFTLYTGSNTIESFNAVHFDGYLHVGFKDGNLWQTTKVNSSGNIETVSNSKTSNYNFGVSANNGGYASNKKILYSYRDTSNSLVAEYEIGGILNKTPSNQYVLAITNSLGDTNTAPMTLISDMVAYDNSKYEEIYYAVGRNNKELWQVSLYGYGVRNIAKLIGTDWNYNASVGFTSEVWIPANINTMEDCLKQSMEVLNNKMDGSQISSLGADFSFITGEVYSMCILMRTFDYNILPTSKGVELTYDGDFNYTTAEDKIDYKVFQKNDNALDFKALLPGEYKIRVS